MYDKLFKLNFVKITNRFYKEQKVYLDRQAKEAVATFEKIQVNSKKFINLLVFNVKNEEIVKELNFPTPNYIIKHKKYKTIQIIYILKEPLNIYNKTINSYYEDIYQSMLKHLKITPKNGTEHYIFNPYNKTSYEVIKKTDKEYELESFRHLIIKEHRLTFKKNRYSFSNNYIFNFLNLYAMKNIYLVISQGKIIIEEKGFEIARSLRTKGKLEDTFTTKKLKEIINKIYNYIIENQEELLKKYGNRGKYHTYTNKVRTLKKKQQVSALLSAKKNSEKKEKKVADIIKKLFTSKRKITVAFICSLTGLSNKTVLKHYQPYKIKIKEHNAMVKARNIEIEQLVREAI